VSAWNKAALNSARETATMGLLSTLGLTLPRAIQHLESRTATPPPSKPSATSIAPGTDEAKPKPEVHAAADSPGNPPAVPPRPRPEADIIAEVGHAEDILNDLNDDAVEFIEHTTGERIPKTNRQGPHRPLKPDQIIPGERLGDSGYSRASTDN
jgi:hypothetical protein